MSMYQEAKERYAAWGVDARFRYCQIEGDSCLDSLLAGG